MTAEQERAAEIAGKLSKVQREAVLSGWGSHEVAMSPEVEPLWFAIRKHGQAGDYIFSISMTDTGLAVRDHLKGQTDGNA